MKYLFVFYPILYTVILSVGIINYSKIRNSYLLKLFLIFIGYSLLTEILGFVLGILYGINTFPIYNTWNVVNHIFYILFFLGLLNNSLKKRILKSFIVLYSIVLIVSIIFFTNFFLKSLNVSIIVIGSLLIVISILVYFSELLQSDLILKLKDSMFFWISIGVLLSNIGFIPVVVIAEYISYSGVYRVIILLLNLITASFFITGFIVSKKELNS